MPARASQSWFHANNRTPARKRMTLKTVTSSGVMRVRSSIFVIWIERRRIVMPTYGSRPASGALLCASVRSSRIGSFMSSVRDIGLNNESITLIVLGLLEEHYPVTIRTDILKFRVEFTLFEEFSNSLAAAFPAGIVVENDIPARDDLIV